MEAPAQSGPLIIAATMLRHYQMCDRRTWLDRYGNRAIQDQPPAISAFRLAEGAAHEQQVHRATARNVQLTPVTSWADGLRVTREWMAQRVSVILGACLEHPIQLDGIDQPIILRGKIDRLERVDADGTLYMPIEIKRYAEPSEADRLQLDCYVWLLSLILNTDLAVGEFWFGSTDGGQPARRITHVFDEARLREALTYVAGVLASSEPPVRLEPHCRDCHWFSSCRKIATQSALDIALIPRLNGKTRAILRQAGIVSLNQIAAMEPDSLKQFKGIKTTAYAIHASARAWVEQQPVWYNRLPPVVRQSGCVFDIETVPETDTVWSIGWSDEHGNGNVVLVDDQSRRMAPGLPDGMKAFVVSSSEEAWRLFARSVSSSQALLYHWTNFDAGVMKKRTPDIWAELSGRLHDLHGTFEQTVRCPITNGKLKTVATYLNYRYAAYERWDWAYRDYLAWLRHGDLQAISRACSYQLDDVKATGLVRQWLADNAPT